MARTLTFVAHTRLHLYLYLHIIELAEITASTF